MNYNHMPSFTCGAYQKCTCRVARLFFEYQQRQHIMMFLMDLNDDFSHIRGQILLLEPLSSITKVYSLVIQDEKHNEVAFGWETRVDNTVAFINKRIDSGKGKPQFKKDKLLCSHCGMTNYTMDKCYKLYEYPPNFKNRGKVSSSSNQISTSPMSTPLDSQSMLFSQEEYQQLLALRHPQPIEASGVNHQVSTITSDPNVLPSHLGKTTYTTSKIHPLCLPISHLITLNPRTLLLAPGS